MFRIVAQPSGQYWFPALGTMTRRLLCLQLELARKSESGDRGLRRTLHFPPGASQVSRGTPTGRLDAVYPHIGRGAQILSQVQQSVVWLRF